MKVVCDLSPGLSDSKPVLMAAPWHFVLKTIIISLH